MKQTEDFTQDTVTDEMNVAGEPDVTVESAEDVAATEAKAAGETVTAEADAVKDALAEAEILQFPPPHRLKNMRSAQTGTSWSAHRQKKLRLLQTSKYSLFRIPLQDRKSVV